MESFQRAVDYGVDVIETDVHQTLDGHIVVSHDASGKRAANVDREIRRCSLSEVQSWDVGWGFVDGSGQRRYAGTGCRIPLLSELLSAFPDMAYNIDLKQHRPKMVEPVLRVLADHAVEERVTLASFHTSNIRLVRQSNFAGDTALSRDEVLLFLATPAALWPRLGIRAESIQIPPMAGPLSVSSRSYIAKCHSVGLRAEYWTINDPIDAEVLLDRGADGIMTDDPKRIAPVFKRLAG